MSSEMTPRISTVATGVRPDGSTYSAGLEANIEFFDLDYLDPGMVRRAHEFAAIAPLLWLQTGAIGERIDKQPDSGWALTNAYGVLFDTDAAGPFADAVTEAASKQLGNDVDGIRLCFVVTKSPTAFERVVERLPKGIPVKQLYNSYLTNFELNTEGPQ